MLGGEGINKLQVAALPGGLEGQGTDGEGFSHTVSLLRERAPVSTGLIKIDRRAARWNWVKRL